MSKTEFKSEDLKSRVEALEGKVNVVEYNVNQTLAAGANINYDLPGYSPTMYVLLGVAFDNAWVNFSSNQYLTHYFSLTITNPSSQPATIGKLKAFFYKYA